MQVYRSKNNMSRALTPSVCMTRREKFEATITSVVSRHRRWLRRRLQRLELIEIPGSRPARATEGMLGGGRFGLMHVVRRRGKEGEGAPAATALRANPSPDLKVDGDVYANRDLQWNLQRNLQRGVELGNSARSPPRAVYGAIVSGEDRMLLAMELPSAADLRVLLDGAERRLPREPEDVIVGDVSAGTVFLRGKTVAGGDLVSSDAVLGGTGKAKIAADLGTPNWVQDADIERTGTAGSGWPPSTSPPRAAPEEATVNVKNPSTRSEQPLSRGARPQAHESNHNPTPLVAPMLHRELLTRKSNPCNSDVSGGTGGVVIWQALSTVITPAADGREEDAHRRIRGHDRGEDGGGGGVVIDTNRSDIPGALSADLAGAVSACGVSSEPLYDRPRRRETASNRGRNVGDVRGGRKGRNRWKGRKEGKEERKEGRKDRRALGIYYNSRYTQEDGEGGRNVKYTSMEKEALPPRRPLNGVGGFLVCTGSGFFVGGVGEREGAAATTSSGEKEGRKRNRVGRGWPLLTQDGVDNDNGNDNVGDSDNNELAE
eukprot:jgi/Undpi1/11039/HiC_scaffold_30.g13339.m1